MPWAMTACHRFASVPGTPRPSMGFLCSRHTFPAACTMWDCWVQCSVFWGVRWFSWFSSVHTSVCVHSYVLMASTEYRSIQCVSFFALVSFYQLLLSFWGVQCSPLNLFSCAQLLSKMMKYVFMQLISSSVSSSKVIQGCLKQNYMPFFPV